MGAVAAGGRRSAEEDRGRRGKGDAGKDEKHGGGSALSHHDRRAVDLPELERGRDGRGSHSRATTAPRETQRGAARAVEPMGSNPEPGSFRLQSRLKEAEKTLAQDLIPSVQLLL